MQKSSSLSGTILGSSETWTSDDHFSGVVGTRSQGTSPATWSRAHGLCGAHVDKSWGCDAGVHILGDTKYGSYTRAYGLSIRGSRDCAFDICCSATAGCG